jgi:hypothetical protein
MGIPLKRGRYLTGQDREGSDKVVAINEAAARKYWPGEEALGKRIEINSQDMTVVGIVGDIRHLGPETPPRQECYVPAAQNSYYGSATLVMRTSGDPLDRLAAVKTAIWAANKDQRLRTETVTLEAYMDRLIAQRRFNMALLALFGILGLVIAAAGIAIGTAAAWWFSAGVKTFLFQVEPNDVRIFVAALAALAAAGLLASAVPARRAASVDPMIALRAE